jgi:hypothetical protein
MQGSPVQHLPALAALIIEKIKANHRCLYLNSPPMVAGIRSYLAAAGMDVQQQTKSGALALSSDQDHLLNGRFDVDRMLWLLMDAVHQAQSDGYAGLWAAGDMTWEMGGENNLSKLIEYECRLETVFQEHPALCGICQYRTKTLPSDLIQAALYTHKAVFINETLSRMNPYYIPPESLAHRRLNTSSTEIQQMLKSLHAGEEL